MNMKNFENQIAPLEILDPSASLLQATEQMKATRLVNSDGNTSLNRSSKGGLEESAPITISINSINQIEDNRKPGKYK